MKRFAFAIVIGMLGPALAHADLKIVTTATDYADIARAIGGSHVDVHSVMKGPENVHNVMAKPTEMLFLNKADLFVHSGLDTEPWRDNLLKGARNPRVLPGKPGDVDMSTGITLKDVPVGKIDRSMGDVHAYGNPHFTASPVTAQQMTVTLVKAMMAADPANAELYRANARKYVTDLADTYRRLKQEFAPYSGLKVVTFHAAWDYFADAFDINIVTTIEPKPAITPSAVEIQRVIQRMKDENVKVVIVETYNSYDQAKSVADAAGAQVIVLPDHVNGLPGTETYAKLFEYDIRKLIGAAKAAGVQPHPVAEASQK